MARHPLPDARWPTESEAAAARWFSPISVGPIELEQRTWVPAMVPWRATEDGFVTPEVLAWYERFARGRPGAIVLEATGIRDVPSGPLLRIGHDRFVPRLTGLVDRVRAASGGHTKLFIQIIDFLAVKRRPVKESYFGRFLRLTDRHRASFPGLADDEIRGRLNELPDADVDRILTPRELEALRFGYRERVTDTDLPHIRELPRVLPDLFASAAVRAREAGFDGVELHFAHAYTMASFLSALNTRTDEYGGSLENRARLPLEVYERVRDRVGRDFVVGVRFLTEDCVAGGTTLEDSEYFGVAFARAGFDYLSLSRGGKFDDAKQPKVGWAVYPYTGPSGWECMPTTLGDARGPFGRNVEATARIRRAMRTAGYDTPVVATGGISTFDQAEAILARGEADIVGAARQSLADPDWYLKIRLGRGSEVRRCTFTNYCEGLDQMHKQVTCKLWDRVDLDEPGIARSADGKRRLLSPEWRP
jgi:2,4-dienoyl-CoA reductase-like NADH-dependent reductase (Old Yellow Enzyme family)